MPRAASGESPPGGLLKAETLREAGETPSGRRAGHGGLRRGRHMAGRGVADAAQRRARLRRTALSRHLAPQEPKRPAEGSRHGARQAPHAGDLHGGVDEVPAALGPNQRAEQPDGVVEVRQGGGDAKLLAASALWLGPDLTLSYLLYASIFGGVLTICIILVRRYPLPDLFSKVSWLVRLHDKRTGIPYGLALGPAALLVFPESAWMSFVSAGSLAG